MPSIDKESFVDALNSLIEDKRIDFIYPAHDDVLVFLAKDRECIKCDVIAPNYNVCQLTRSKRMTYNFFKDIIKVPKTVENLTFPIFMKPDIGEAARNTAIIYNIEELKAHQQINKGKGLMGLEYLPGKEYTIDCFTNRKRELLFIGARERVQFRDGISVDAVPVEDMTLNKMASIINNELELTGAWFFQTKKRKSGEQVLMEIAPRIAGGTGMYRMAGVNLALLSVLDAAGEDVEILKNKKVFNMERTWRNSFEKIEYRHLYIDYDDTLMINGKENPLAMALIYQCKNSGIKVNLITKGDLSEVKHKEIFNNVIWVEYGKCKSDYINESNSIFVDDSFRERKDVRRKRGIPVFDVNCIEYLLDWRR